MAFVLMWDTSIPVFSFLFFWVIGFLVGYSATQSSNQCRAVIRNSNRHPGVTRVILGAHNCDFSESKNQFITTDLKTNWKCQMTNDCLSNCQLFTDSLMEPSDLCGFWNNCNQQVLWFWFLFFFSEKSEQAVINTKSSTHPTLKQFSLTELQVLDIWLSLRRDCSLHSKRRIHTWC